MTGQTEALLVGGRAGVGKTTVGYEIHEQLSAAGLRHCLIEGDNGHAGYGHALHEADLRSVLSAVIVYQNI